MANFYQNNIQSYELDEKGILFEELFQKDAKIMRLIQRGMKGKYADQSGSEFGYVDQSRIDVEELIQKELFVNPKLLFQGSFFDQNGMKGKHVNQSGSVFNSGIGQTYIDVKTLNHSGIKSQKTNHEGAKLGTLITDSETNYGDWNLENAKIDSWEGEEVLFDKVDITGAELPRELYGAICVQEALREGHKFTN